LGKHTFDINATTIQIVGELNLEAIKLLIGVEFPVPEVHMYPGAIKHAKKRHPGIIEQYGHLIPDIISNPDYIGQNPKETVPSLELIKLINPHLILAIKLDPSGYLFVGTFFDLKNGPEKVKKRLTSGRLKPYTL
jgi:hypothetical protein